MRFPTSHPIFILFCAAVLFLATGIVPTLPASASAATTAVTPKAPDAPPAPAKASPKKEIPEKLHQLGPVYPGAELISAIESPKMVKAIFSAKADIKKIMDWYKKELTKGGWEVLHERIKNEGQEARLVLKKSGQQIGFSAQQQSKDSAVFFISLH